MAQREDRINELLNGRAFMGIMAVAYVLLSGLAVVRSNIAITQAGYGIFFPSPEALIANKWLSWGLNTVCNLAIAGMLLTLNRIFNFVRAYTAIFASTFLLLEACNPLVSVQLYVGSLLCLIVVAMAFAMFARYQDKDHSQRTIYLLSAFAAFCSLFHYSFLFLVPVLLLGFIQMRTMNLRSAVAMLMGLATPFWIGLGLGLINPFSFNLPHLSSIFTTVADQTQPNADLITAVVTALLTVVLSCVNLFTLLNYRLQIRLYNTFFDVLTVLAILVMCTDFDNVVTYLPVLNMCLAVQVGHSFTIAATTKRYLLIVLLIVLAAANYILLTT